jgi:peptidase E
MFAPSSSRFALVLLLLAPLASAGEPTRRIFAVGGKTFANTDRDQLMLRYLLGLTGKKEPTVYYLPTAGGDAAPSIVNWYEVAHELPCRPRHLRLFDGSSHLRDLEGQLLSADIVFVGGGNTLNMLAVWKAQGVDAILKRAWERGTILAGESAGMICWFEQGLTDSRPERLTAMDCLGWLKGSACPHYNLPERKSNYHRLLAAGEFLEGVACDDRVAVLYEGDRLSRAVSTDARAKAYRVRRDGTKIVEEPLQTEVLTKR